MKMIVSFTSQRKAIVLFGHQKRYRCVVSVVDTASELFMLLKSKKSNIDLVSHISQ